MTIYQKKEELRKEWKLLQQEYLMQENFLDYLKIRTKEEKIYKKFLFFKNYLNAERKLK